MSIKYNNQNVGLTLPGGSEAEDITYDPTTSGAFATNVQDALDEAFSSLENKQDTLTFDAAPTANSTNPVQSGGVYTDVRTRVPNYGKGQNILRNWYFKTPVNQRGATSGTTTNNAYFLDGWKTTYGTASGTWALTSSGLQVISAANTYAVIMQNVEDALLNGFALTASALYSDGTIDTAMLASRTSGTNQYFGTGVSWQLDANGILRRRVYDTQTIVAIKLELGTEQTLAHQENGVWVLNEIPDYEEELIKCQTSTADSSDTYANKSLATEQQLAYVETGTTASRVYSVGEYFCWNGLLYRAIQPIANGGTFTPGTNCVLTTVMNEIPIILPISKSSNTSTVTRDLSGYGIDVTFLVVFTPSLGATYSSMYVGHYRNGNANGCYVYSIGSYDSTLPAISIDTAGTLTISTTASYTNIRIIIL